MISFPLLAQILPTGSGTAVQAEGTAGFDQLLGNGGALDLKNRVLFSSSTDDVAETEVENEESSEQPEVSVGGTDEETGKRTAAHPEPEIESVFEPARKPKELGLTAPPPKWNLSIKSPADDLETAPEIRTTAQPVLRETEVSNVRSQKGQTVALATPDEPPAGRATIVLQDQRPTLPEVQKTESSQVNSQQSDTAPKTMETDTPHVPSQMGQAAVPVALDDLPFRAETAVTRGDQKTPLVPSEKIDLVPVSSQQNEPTAQPVQVRQEEFLSEEKMTAVSAPSEARDMAPLGVVIEDKSAVEAGVTTEHTAEIKVEIAKTAPSEAPVRFNEAVRIETAEPARADTVPPENQTRPMAPPADGLPTRPKSDVTPARLGENAEISARTLAESRAPAPQNAEVLSVMKTGVVERSDPAKIQQRGPSEPFQKQLAQGRAEPETGTIKPQTTMDAGPPVAPQPHRSILTPVQPTAEMQPAPAPQPSKSPIVRQVMEQLVQYPTENGVATIRLKPHGMGVIEITVDRAKDGGLNVDMRVQNPLVLEAMRSERGAISHLFQPTGNNGNGTLSMDLFQSGTGREDQQRQGQNAQNKPSGEAQNDADTPEESTFLARNGQNQPSRALNILT